MQLQLTDYPAKDGSPSSETGGADNADLRIRRSGLSVYLNIIYMNELYKQLKMYGKVKIDEPMSKHTTFKIGGPAKYFVIVEDIGKLVELLKYLDGAGEKFMMLGGGSNMLISDTGYDGVIIKLQVTSYKLQNDVIIASAGCTTVEIAQKSIAEKLTGFEWGVGVPGTIGGAVRGNAGAMGGEMKDSVLKVEVYRDGEVIELSREECEFGYRDSVFKHTSDVILRVYLELENTEDNELAKKAIEHLQYRNKTQPQGYSSSGCMFKNVEVKSQKSKVKSYDIPQEFLDKGIIPAGWLVDQVGMKGYAVGNAQVSDKHGNFLINTGGATASDMLSIIDEIKTTVYTEYGIELEEEVHII